MKGQSSKRWYLNVLQWLIFLLNLVLVICFSVSLSNRRTTQFLWKLNPLTFDTYLVTRPLSIRTSNGRKQPLLSFQRVVNRARPAGAFFRQREHDAQGRKPGENKTVRESRARQRCYHSRHRESRTYTQVRSFVSLLTTPSAKFSKITNWVN